MDNTHIPPFDWTTYPQRLQKAGIDWKIYQDLGNGLDAAHNWGFGLFAPYIGNFGDNALLYFKDYQNAVAGQPLFDRARLGTDVDHTPGTTFFDQLAQDVQNNTLPQVTWIASPEAFSEHPNWPANFGAWYISKVLDALTSNPEVWAKTALFLTYDENDGFFDHVVPPYPSVGTLSGDSTVRLDNELYRGPDGTPGPYGLGVRVPMTVISPWSTGGWVNSETFDHTSIIRFIEKRFGVHEPNITPWRRAVCGDLTSAFDFSATPSAPPTLPSTDAYLPPDNQRHPSVFPDPPVAQRVPKQEPGVRPSRALGYRLHVDLHVTAKGLDFTITNGGTLGAQLQARSNNVAGAPFSYTVGAGKKLRPHVSATGAFDISVHGPDGFFRRFAGNTKDPLLEVHARRQGGKLLLRLHNRSDKALKVNVAGRLHVARCARPSRPTGPRAEGLAQGGQHAPHPGVVRRAGLRRGSSARQARPGRTLPERPGRDDGPAARPLTTRPSARTNLPV